MAIRATSATKNPMLVALANQFAGGTLEIRTGARPTSIQSPRTGTVLWTKVLPNPSLFVASGVATKLGTWSALPSANGLAGYWTLRLAGDTNVLSDGDPRIDGTIVLSGNAGDATVNDLNFVTSQAVEILTFNLRLP